MDGAHFTTKDWSDADTITNYNKSKLLAERLAWEIAGKNNLNLTTICPGYTIGPLLFKKYNFTQQLIEEVMQGKRWFQARPNCVSVNDVARAHVKSLEYPELSRNKRYILVENSNMFTHFVDILRKHFDPKGTRIKRWGYPRLFVKLHSYFNQASYDLYLAHYQTYQWDNQDYVQDFG